MVSQQNDMPEEVVNLYAAHGYGQRSLSLAEYLSLLSSFPKSFRRSFILVDALDEHFTNGKEKDNVLQLNLLDELLELQKQWSGCKRYTLFFTSRENDVIRERLAGSVRIDIRAANSDVESYVRSRIANPRQFSFARQIRGDTKLTNTIINRVTEKAQGMSVLFKKPK